MIEYITDEKSASQPWIGVHAKVEEIFPYEKSCKFMNVEQVNYVAGISHKGPVLVLHDEYMLEHGTFFLDFTNDLDSQNMYTISVATRNPLQWTNSFKFLEKLNLF